MLLLLFAAGATDPVTPPVPPPAQNVLSGGGGAGNNTQRPRSKTLWQDDTTGPQPFAAMMRNIAIALIASGALEEFD